MNRQHSTKSQWSSFSVDFFAQSLDCAVCVCARAALLAHGSGCCCCCSVFAYFVSAAVCMYLCVCRRVVARALFECSCTIHISWFFPIDTAIRALYLSPCIFISTALCTLNLVFASFHFSYSSSSSSIIHLLLHSDSSSLSLDIYLYPYIVIPLYIVQCLHIFKLKIEHRIYEELICTQTKRCMHHTSPIESSRVESYRIGSDRIEFNRIRYLIDSCFVAHTNHVRSHTHTLARARSRLFSAMIK